MLDASQRSVLEFGVDGRRIASQRSTIAGSLDRLAPREAWPVRGGGLVVEGYNSFFSSVAPGLGRMSPPYDLIGESNLRDIFPYRWGLTHDSLELGGMVVCGEIQRIGDADWERGVFYIPLTGEDRTPILVEEFVLPDLRQIGCKLGGQVIASLHGTAYVLLLDDHPETARPEIFEIELLDGGEARLTPIQLNLRPEPMKVSPDLPLMIRRGEYAGVMQDLNEKSLPVELVGWGDHLYLLMREPGSDGSTRWTVAKIDPNAAPGETNVVVASIDSAAADLSMIPGPRQWAFVEKAAPRSLQEQDVLGFKIVPATLMRDVEKVGMICQEVRQP